MATALVTQIAYAVQTLFDPAGTAGRLVDLGKLANYGLLTNFTPGYLFTTGVNGAWYDPSDITTLYRDAAGTTPVTAVEQPVGLMLDKSKGLVLGPERINNGDFSQGSNGWTLGANWSITGGQAVKAAGASDSTLTFAGGFQSGKWYRIEFDIASQIGINYLTGITPSATITASGARRAVFVGYAVSSNFTIYGVSTSEIVIDNISVRELPGNHAFNNSGNSANFPVLKEDATGRKYLSFNGTNQWLQTNSIDFTYGDKMFVSAGVRKLSDASVGLLTELSTNLNSNFGSLFLAAPVTAGDNFAFASKGSNTQQGTASGYPAPITNVLSGIGNISGDQAILRVNGTQAAINTGDQGTGNFGNYPLYIGARGGTSLWFNGRLYGMVVAGKQATAAEITSTETYINQKTGAY